MFCNWREPSKIHATTMLVPAQASTKGPTFLHRQFWVFSPSCENAWFSKIFNWTKTVQIATFLVFQWQTFAIYCQERWHIKKYSKLRDQTLDIKSREQKCLFFVQKISLNFFSFNSSYAKIWEGTKFQLPEYPQSGWKAISVEEEEREKENGRTKVSVNNGNLIR